MIQHLVLSILCDDRPGVVKRLASTISTHGGNWLESQLIQMAGKFAGVVRVAIAEDEKASLCAALSALEAEKIRVYLDQTESTGTHDNAYFAEFSLAGPDRHGIVLEMSQAFAQYSINVEALNTQCSSMPYSGDPLFEAEGTLSVPNNTDWVQLHEQLLQIADELGIDIQLHKHDA